MATLRDRLWDALSTIEGVDTGSSVFADDDTSPALWVDGKQITNFVADDRIEVRLTKKVVSAERARLRADARVELRRNPSDWVTVRYSDAADIAFVRELVDAATAAHRPRDGRRPRPPPSNADLARRRRFH